MSLLFFLAFAASQTALPVTLAGDGSYLRHEDFRVASVAHRIGKSGGAYCDAAYPSTGLALHHLGEYSPADRAEASATFGLSRGPGVVAVVPGSAAARALLKAGDVLVSIDGRKLPDPALAAAERDEKKRRQIIEETDTAIEAALMDGTAILLAIRESKELELLLRPDFACASRARLARSNQANAFADGRYAIMTTRMLAEVRDDDELAVLMAHEIAHNILGHRDRLRGQKVPNGVLRSIGKNAARVRTTEAEADRLAMQLVWSAGYRVEAAIPFWRRLYSKLQPITMPKFLRTHPSFSEREKAITEIVEELRAAGRPPQVNPNAPGSAAR